MRKSRSDTAETKKRIIATASKMFLDRGIDSVGMRDVMAAAELTVGGFYRHFESKGNLVAEANALALSRIFAMLEASIAGQPWPKALDTIVELYLGQARDKRNTYLCPLAMIGSELARGNKEAREVAFDGYKRLEQLIADHLPRRAKPGTAASIVSIMVGAVTLSNMTPDRAAASFILSAAAEAIRSLGRQRVQAS